MLNKKQIKDFHDKGYTVVNFINKKKLNLIKIHVSSMILESIKYNLPKYYKKNLKKLKNNNFILNDGMIKLESSRHKYLSNIYDIIAKGSSLLDLLCDEKILLAVNQLMKRKLNHQLYLNCNSIGMDMPKDDKFMYGWHRDNNTNIPDSNFIQVWMPLHGFLGKSLGGLKILEKSHKKNLMTTESKNEMKRLIGNVPMRSSISAKVFGHDLYKEKIIELNAGQALMFKNSLMHKGALNTSENKVRYVVSCFYHDVRLLEKKFINRDFKDKNVKVVRSDNYKISPNDKKKISSE